MRVAVVAVVVAVVAAEEDPCAFSSACVGVGT